MDPDNRSSLFPDKIPVDQSGVLSPSEGNKACVADTTTTTRVENGTVDMKDECQQTTTITRDFTDNVEDNVADELPTAALQCFDGVLIAWMNEILKLEGTVRNNDIVRLEVSKVIERLLQDGLISPYEHDSLSHANTLFVRLHDLISMKVFSDNRKREVLEILIDLFEMNKITKPMFVELCLNIL